MGLRRLLEAHSRRHEPPHAWRVGRERERLLQGLLVRFSTSLKQIRNLRHGSRVRATVQPSRKPPAPRRGFFPRAPAFATNGPEVGRAERTAFKTTFLSHQHTRGAEELAVGASLRR